MIRAVLLLARTSLLSVLVLAASLLALISVLSDPPGHTPDSGPDLAAALAPMPKRHPPASEGAALRIALFDPERRAETVSGSIDDLRGSASAPPPEPANVVLSGVLIDGHKARAMLSVIGGPAHWSEVGAEVGGWRLTRIDAKGAVLEHDGRTLALTVAERWKTHGQAHAAAEGAPATDATGAPPDTPTPADALVAPDAVEPQNP